MHSKVKALHDYSALCLGLGLLALMCLVWTPCAALLDRLLPARLGPGVGRRTITAAFRGYLWLLGRLGLVRADLAALDALRTAPPLVIAPNHPGLLDAVLILSRLPNVGCVVRADRLGHPLLGAGARLAGYIPNDHLHGMIKRAVADLRAGAHLLLFPEGTRTTRWPVNPFKGSPALIAQRAGAPIQTVFIETGSPFLGKDWPLFRRPPLPIVVRVRLGRRFPPPARVRECTAGLERYFLNELAALPAPVSSTPGHGPSAHANSLHHSSGPDSQL